MSSQRILPGAASVTLEYSARSPNCVIASEKLVDCNGQETEHVRIGHLVCFTQKASNSVGTFVDIFVHTPVRIFVRTLSERVHGSNFAVRNLCVLQ